MAPLAELRHMMPDDMASKLRWTDQGGRPLAVENADMDDLVNKVNPPRITSHRNPNIMIGRRSNMKGSRSSSQTAQQKAKAFGRERSKFLAKTSQQQQENVITGQQFFNPQAQLPPPPAQRV